MTTTENKHTTETFDALVALALSLRPSWHQDGVRQAVRAALLRQPMPALADLAYALVRLAIDPTITAPVVLAMDGPHWREQTHRLHAPLIPGRCPKCHQFHGVDTDGDPVDAVEAVCREQHDTDYAALALDHMAKVRGTFVHVMASLCPHGVKWVDCRRHDTDVVAGEVTETEEETADA